jgi:hypothetical protein
VDHTRMNAPSDPEPPAEWRVVHFREYPEALDMRGKDLISSLTRSKEEVSSLVGPMVAKSEMRTEELPGESVTSSTGEVADEVHEWPNATLGSGFRHLMLQFREGRLMHMSWKFQGPPLRHGKPWWKFW